MARTIKQIKEIMTTAFMADPEIRKMYGIEDGRTFEQHFSPISIENLLFYIVASVCNTIEVIFDLFREEIDERIAKGTVATVSWYYSIARNFQYGDDLIWDEDKQTFNYKTQNIEKQIIKYVSVRDEGNGVGILVAKDKEGYPSPLEEMELSAFKAYMSKVKFAGVYLRIMSGEPDKLKISAKVQVDPLVINIADGTNINNGDLPVNNAINKYIKNIVYGGTLNKTKLIDAIQSETGIIDILIEKIEVQQMGQDYIEIDKNNYTAIGGCFKIEDLNITYYVDSF